MTQNEIQLQVTFPDTPDQVPTYVNVTFVSKVSGDIFLDFGFVDPTSLTRQVLSQDIKENAAQAKLLVRLVASRQTAEQLLNQLKLQLESPTILES